MSTPAPVVPRELAFPISKPTDRRRRRRTALWMALLCWGLLPPVAQAQADAAASAPRTERAAVGVARLDAVWLKPEREAPASVVARNESKLSAETSGILQRWTADVGAQVKKGQLLAQIDPRDAELAVERARAALNASNVRLKLAQTQLERSRELVAQGFFSQEALAQRESEVAVTQSEARSNQSQLATAQRQLAKTTLRAPFDGSITARLAQTGEAVAPGSVLFVLTDSRAAEVAATLGPADVPGLRRATDLRLETPAGRHALRLLRVAATVSVPARTQEARLAFVQADEAPPAGTSGSLRWTANQPHVPPSLLVRRGAGLGVFVQRGQGGDARARFVPLPGAQEGRASALPDSLGADTPIVVRGQAALRDGLAIEALPQ